MPYSTNNDLPDDVKSALPGAAQTIFRNAFNEAIKDNDESGAAAIGWTAVKNAGYKKDGDSWVKNLEAGLKSREIFSAGTWNGDKYTEEDLDAIVSNYEKLRDEIKPPLKLGHRNLKGQPALGWVSKVYRSGKKLMADFSKIPDVVARAINKSGYPRVSCEIFPTFTAADGKKYNNVLAAVALLGADIPAVGNLADLAKIYTLPEGSGEPKIYEVVLSDDSDEIQNQKTEEEKMTKEYETKIKTLSDDLEKTVKLLSESESKVKEYEAKFVQHQKDKYWSSFLSYCDKRISDGKMAPAVKKVYEDNKDSILTENGVIIPFSIQEKIDAINVDPKAFDTDEKAKNKGKKSETENIDTMAKKYMTENKVEYDEAIVAVMRDNPEMATNYLSDTITVTDDE